MPATVYKGDLSEVTFGHETGLILTHGHFTNGLTATRANSGDITTITLATASAISFSSAGVLRYPKGMLVGCKLRVIGSGNWAGTDGDNEFTIVYNAGAEIKVTPAMAATSALSAGDSIVINSYGCPTMDGGMVYAANADASDETVLTDQFVGLAATVTLPETKANILRKHIVGIGRDVVIQEPQSFKNDGGSIEMMMNSPRWLYFALGAQCAIPSATWTTVEASGQQALAISAGDVYIEFSAAMTSAPAAGDYIEVVDTTDVNLPTSHTDPANGVKFTGAQTNFQTSQKNEVRRVIMVDETVGGARRIYVDSPFCFDHAAALEIRKMTPADDNTGGCPNFNTAAASYGEIQNYISRAIWSNYHVPSFALETSMRTRDVDSYGTGGYAGSQSTNSPGSASDAKQLTRVYKGCKVKEWGITADADAEVKMNVSFDAAMCYTDTGRLESGANTGDRFTAHRMFENVANGPLERKKAGIAPNTEKPYFFYNGQINAFGITIANVTNFNLTGRNNIATHYTVRGTSFAEARVDGKSTEQVPFSGMRNPALLVEGKTEYDLSMTVIVDDPLLWHEFRTNRKKDHATPITLTLNKAGAGSNRESMTIIIDDYIIQEAGLPIPEDKGVIKSELKIMPMHVKAISRDALLH